MSKNRKFSLDNTDKETLQKWYYLMTLGRQLDNKAPNYLKQALGWSYHAPYAGHDGIQLAIGQFFDKEVDFLFPYYRDMLTTISAGLTAEEIILNGASNERHCIQLSDPMERFRVQLIHSKKFTEEELADLDEKAKKVISAAHKRVLKAPDPGPATIFDFVIPEPYVPEKYTDGKHDGNVGEPKRLIVALNETLKAEFRHNPDTYIWG